MKSLPKPWHVLTICIAVVINCLVGCKKETTTEPAAPPPNPVVRIVSPTSSTILQDSILVQVEATDDKGIVKVEIYVDNQVPQSGTLLYAPYSYLWNLTSFPDSSVHTLYAKAYDGDGNVTSSPVLTLVLFKFAPSNLSASVSADTLVTLSWKDNSRKETGFEVERKTGAGDFVLVKTVGPDVTTVGISGAYRTTDGSSFRVRAFSTTDKSKYSNTISTTVVFPAPSNLVVTSIAENSATLQWKDNSLFETGFLIEQSTDGVSFGLVDSTGANVATKSVLGLYVQLSTYTFRVRAKSAYNVSAYSNVNAASLFASMVMVTGGTFQMGSATGSTIERPIHSVTVSTFYIDKTEITYVKWTDVRNWGLTHGYSDLVAGTNSSSVSSNHPVNQISWYDAVKWCNARSEQEGLTPVYYTNNTLNAVYRTGNADVAVDAVRWTANGYRLATEAEWEFASGGGTKSLRFIYSGSNIVDSVAWYVSNSGNSTQPVSKKAGNELGLYDLSGNVAEWCWDWYGTYSSSAQSDPKGPTPSQWRLSRGGAYNYDANGCRVTVRNYNGPDIRNPGYGLRCVHR